MCAIRGLKMTDLEHDWLQRLADGSCKVRRYPSGQWSRGGNKFRDTKKVQAMLGRKWIERIATTNGGIELYDITDDGRKALRSAVS